MLTSLTLHVQAGQKVFQQLWLNYEMRFSSFVPLPPPRLIRRRRRLRRCKDVWTMLMHRCCH